jgi:hypothetical protein
MGYRLVYPKVIRKRERRERMMTGRDAVRSRVAREPGSCGGATETPNQIG